MLDLSKLKTGTPLLITFDDWFTAPNGQTYKYAWGNCKVLPAKSVLGFEPKGGVNWMIQIGDGPGAVFAMGCRVHYAVVCESRPVGNCVYCTD